MEPWEMGVEDSEDEELCSSDEEFADETLHNTNQSFRTKD